VSKELLAEPQQPPAPAALPVRRFRSLSEQGSTLVTALARTPAAAPDEHDEDEGAAKCHEKNLPPCKWTSPSIRDGRRKTGDAGKGG